MLLAKSKPDKTGKYISLNQHTKDVMEQAKLISQTNQFSERQHQILQFCAGMHDLGKILPSFQRQMNQYALLPNKQEYNNISVYDLKIPHNYFSLFFIDKTKILEILQLSQKKKELQELSNEDELKIILNAVGFHHWRENSIGLILGEIEQLDVIELQDAIKMEKMLKEEMKDIHMNFDIDGQTQSLNLSDFIKFDRNLFGYLKKGGSFIETGMLTPPYLLAFLPDRILQAEQITRESTIFLGNLMRADHFASFSEDQLEESGQVEMEPLTAKSIYDAIKQQSQEKNWQPPFEESWQNITMETFNNHDKAILLAPTGAGKTEFAYLFSRNKKMVFSLPLRAAVNSVFERSSKLFGHENCTIMHSDAQLFLYNQFNDNINQPINEDTMGSIKKITNISRLLGYPVQICTGDQIFPAALKYPGYERIFSVLSESCLIIDEIQAYDPKAIAVIITLIREAIIMGARVLLMTATLPEFLKKDLVTAFGLENEEELSAIIINKYKEEQFGNSKKHHVVLENKMPNDQTEIEKMIQLAREGKRVLVIRNKVKNAQDTYQTIYDRLPGEEIEKLFLLHSKFTQSDRAEKEKQITNIEFKNPKEKEHDGKILVATQIVEASLDIDADYLFTDIAPADAIIQRMGRINRRYRTGNHAPATPNVFIYCGKNKKEDKKVLYSGVYLEDIIKPTIEAFRKALKDNNFILDEKTKAGIVENVYTKENLKDTYYRKYKQTLELLEKGYTSDSKREAQKLFRDIFQIQIIPGNLKDEVDDKLNEEFDSYLDFRRKIISPYVIGVSPYSVEKENLKKSKYHPFKEEIIYSKQHIYDKNLGLLNKKAISSDQDKKVKTEETTEFI
jgi:CRISPR-associated endonuclease/helicase Cas3